MEEGPRQDTASVTVQHRRTEDESVTGKGTKKQLVTPINVQASNFLLPFQALLHFFGEMRETGSAELDS